MTYDRSGQPDRELVQEALAGDPTAIDAFVDRMRCIPRFLALLNRRSAAPLDASTADDLAQEVFAAVWKRLPEYRGEAALSTWVWQFCLRMSASRRRVAARGGREVGVNPELPEFAVEGEDPRDDQALHAALEALPPEERAVVVAKHFGDLTFREAGIRFGDPENTIKTRYYRAIERLRRALSSSFGLEDM